MTKVRILDHTPMRAESEMQVRDLREWVDYTEYVGEDRTQINADLLSMIVNLSEEVEHLKLIINQCLHAQGLVK